MYEDFYAYDSGIYQHVEGDFIGVQSARIVGWGVTADNVHFWRLANSWVIIEFCKFRYVL